MMMHAFIEQIFRNIYYIWEDTLVNKNKFLPAWNLLKEMDNKQNVYYFFMKMNAVEKNIEGKKDTEAQRGDSFIEDG